MKLNNSSISFDWLSRPGLSSLEDIALPTTKLNLTFDGETPVEHLYGYDAEVWSGGFLGYYDEFTSEDDVTFVANVSISGSNWHAATLRFGGQFDNKTIIRDLDGGNRSIEYLQLGSNSDVKLLSTHVELIAGSVGNKHELSLGAAHVDFIKLLASANVISTESGVVGSIIAVGESNVITTGAGEVGTITTNGDSVIRIGVGGAEAVTTGSGTDTVITGATYVQSISTGRGDDEVRVGREGAGLVHLGKDDDIIKISGFLAGEGVRVSGGSGVDTAHFGQMRTKLELSLSETGFQVLEEKTDGVSSVILNNIENLIGGRQSDHLKGNDLDNLLNGSRGNDILVGLAGNDLLIGGAGKDVFVFGQDGGIDSVRDFTDDVDLLRIEGNARGFRSLDFSKQGGDLHIGYDTGTIILIGDAGLKLTAADFDFV